MESRSHSGKIKKLLRNAVLLAFGFVFVVLLLSLGVLCMAVCVVWELADYLLKKMEGRWYPIRKIMVILCAALLFAAAAGIFSRIRDAGCAGTACPKRILAKIFI